MSQTSLHLQVVVNPAKILPQLNSGRLLMLDTNSRGGLIICKRHHAELAGPGAAVGGLCDIDCGRVIPFGDVSIVSPQSYEHRQKAFVMRQKWFRFTQKAMENPVPLQRAHSILFLIEKYFGTRAVDQLPDEILAQLVGVLPKTITMVRQAKARQLASQQEQRLVAV
jgi:hypothetical protein